MNFNPFIDLISSILTLYSYAIFIWVIVSLLKSFQIINSHSIIVIRITEFLNSLINPVIRRIRKFIPPIAGIDLSPLILILLLQFLQNILYSYLYR